MTKMERGIVETRRIRTLMESLSRHRRRCRLRWGQQLEPWLSSRRPNRRPIPHLIPSLIPSLIQHQPSQ
jgi:hypothetical protein